MKTNPYVALHQSKALALSIGRHSKELKIIEPFPHKLRSKFTAFTGYFPFKEPASAQVLASACKTL